MAFIYAFLVVSCVHVCLSQPKMEQNPDGMGGKMSFTPPSLNDEESHSSFMPDNLKCDACSAIAYQFSNKLAKLNEKFKSLKGKLPESELIDAFESVCDSKTFENYGLKEVGGVKHISGDGIEGPAKDAPGVMQGGGKWPGRMLDMCESYVGEIGELELHAQYQKYLKKKTGFKKYLCNGDVTLRGSCLKKEQKEEL